MGAPAPTAVQQTELTTHVMNILERIAQGKVRDNFKLGDKHILMTASDRISIFDFVLNATVHQKGEILTALTIFWLTKVVSGIKHHLVAFGADIDEYLPKELHGNTDLQKRSYVVNKLVMASIECIARGWLTGSGLRDYNKTGEVCGHKLPKGLHDGSELLEPIFTPSTKAESGHDENISAESVRAMFGSTFEDLTLKVYMQIRDFAKTLGIILADFKLEFSVDFVLGDEVGSPDACRFWLVNDWKKSQKEKRSPSSYDKDVVRKWGKTVKTPFNHTDGSQIIGINNLDPDNETHLKFVHELEVPQNVLDQTSHRYHDIFQKLTGQTLVKFQKETMHITH